MNMTGRSAELLGVLAEWYGCETHTDQANGRANYPAPAGYCLDQGRQVIASQGVDQACWPCVITTLLGRQETEGETP